MSMLSLPVCRTCLVIVIISILFVFLIGLLCLLHVFRTIYFDFKSEKTTSSFKTTSCLVYETESTVLVKQGVYLHEMVPCVLESILF
jgi:uncharacterized membrane protein